MRRKPAALFTVALAAIPLLGQIPYLNWRSLVPPVEGALIIRQDAKGGGQFGVPRSGGRRHNGIDLAAPVGAPVLAIRSGRVAVATTRRGEGQYIVLDHGGGWRSVYLHLSAMDVRLGQRVRQGQRIGAVGKTGNARHPLIAPHLHIEITHQGTPVDPASLGLYAVVPRAGAPPTDAGSDER